MRRDPDVPNWFPKLKRAAREHGLTVSGAITLADIRHDDWCARLQGAGVCDCDPDVHLVTRQHGGGSP